jgi:chemotaxis protein CheZ
MLFASRGDHPTFVNDLAEWCSIIDAAIYRELRDIADYMQTMKIEIGVLGVNEIREAQSPTADEELGAVAKAQREPTNTIMDCAEAVASAYTEDVEAFKVVVDKKMIVIFEA